MNGRPWSEDEIAKVRDLASEGNGPLAISRVMGRNERTVAKLMERKGIRRANRPTSRKSRPKEIAPSRELIAAEVALRRQIMLAKAERATAKPYKRGSLEW